MYNIDHTNVLSLEMNQRPCIVSLVSTKISNSIRFFKVNKLFARNSKFKALEKLDEKRIYIHNIYILVYLLKRPIIKHLNVM